MGETAEKRKFKIKGKEVSRGEFIKSKRQEKKAKVRAFRSEHGIPEPEKKQFDLNNEKVWFKNTWKQVKVQLMNKFVKRMRSFRITLKKLEETDTSGLDEAKRKTIELKMRRCTNGEKLMEKEMYMIKGWHHFDIFNMLISTPEMAFTAAVAITDKTGDMTPRARERVRAHPLVAPIMARIKRELVGFEKQHEQSDTGKVEALSEKVEQSVKVVMAAKKEVETEETKNEESNDNRFSLDKFESLKMKAIESDDRVDEEEEKEEEETEEIEEFNEYSSDEENEEDESDKEVENDEEDESGYDIEFVMPKFLQKESTTKQTESSEKTKAKVQKSNSNDFFIENEADKYAQSDQDSSDNDLGDIKDQGNPGDTDGFFLGEDGTTAAALKRANIKSKTAKTRALNQGGKDNRLGQRERKKLSKSVYGKHTQEVEKQEKKFRERKTKRKGEEKEEKKEEHPSWQARKKAKAESSIKQFEGTKVVFDDSD